MKKLNLFLHLLGQVVAQTAVAAVVPTGYEKYYAAFVAIIGVLIAFLDEPKAQ